MHGSKPARYGLSVLKPRNTRQIDYHTFGIPLPDLIGYEGGQPVTLKDGTKLAVGFSGFRGGSDLEIVVRAVERRNRDRG